MAAWGLVMLVGGLAILPAAYFNMVWDAGIVKMIQCLLAGLIVLAFGGFFAYSGARMLKSAFARHSPTSSS